MAAITFKPHRKFFLDQLTGTSPVNFASGTYKVALFNSTAAINVNTSETYSTSNEVTGTNYTAGGATVANVSVQYDSGENTFEIRGDSVTWAQHASGFNNARYAVFYHTGSNKIIASSDLGSNHDNQTYTLMVIPTNNEYLKVTRPA